MASSLRDRRGSNPENIEVTPFETIRVQPKSGDGTGASSTSSRGQFGGAHGTPTVLDGNLELEDSDHGAPATWQQQLRSRRKTFFAYIKTRDFWIVLVLGQVLAIANTGAGTFTTLLGMQGTSIPSQTLLNYILLNLIYTSTTIYRYGFKKWLRLCYRDGWRYFILAFFDVEGNYFTVLAYRYTTVLSAQLINFWAIVIVVVISFTVLKVRYRFAQYAGIVVCIAGQGLLIASDSITGSNGGSLPRQWRGDLWALGGATFYGFSNVFEEFLVSEKPLYEVVGQLAFWGLLINGTQAGIFDRAALRSATWNGPVAGYLVGYTLVLTVFYSIAPIVFRLSSAAFFNISLLTMNFWGVAIGIHVLHIHMHYLYPVAFVLVIVGLLVYFLTDGILGESKKPWLGENQEKGISGVGTARRKVEREEVAGVIV